MTSNIKKINNCFSRVYADIKISDGAFSIHLMDITSGDLNNSFWDFLNNNIKLSFKPIKNISKKYLKNLNFIEPDDTISLINNSLISLYKKADLFDSNTNINTKAVTKLNIDYSSQEKPVSFVNKTNNLIKITGNKDHLFPLSSIFLENKDSSPISYLIPNNYNFVAGNSPFNSQSIDKLQLDQNPDEVFKAFLNTLNHISEIYFESIQNRSLKYLKDEKESFDFGTATLGDFLPKIVNEDTKDIGSSSKFENVYFAVGKILRVESRASELYPYVDFSDCDTEYDATIKLLNTSGVPYRVSEAPSRYIDDRSYLFISEDEKVCACLRYGSGYKILNKEKEKIVKDGEEIPQGQIITLFPTTPAKPSAWEFIKIGMEDAWLPFSLVILTCILLAAATLIPAFIISQLTSLYIPYGGLYSLIFFGISALGVLTLIYFIQLIQARYLVRFEIIADSNLQTMMVDRLLRLRPELVSTYTVGSMQSRVLGISTLRSTITSNLIPILTAYLSVIFNFVYLWTFSGKMATIVIIGALILAISTYYAATKRIKYFSAMTELDGKMLATTNDAINGISELRAFGTSGDYFEKYGSLIRPLIGAIFNSTTFRDRVDLLTDMVMYITYIFLLPTAYFLVNSGEATLTIGSVIAFLTCTNTFLSKFEQAIDKTITSAVQVATYWQRAQEVISLEAEKSSLEGTPKVYDGSITARRLSFSIQSSKSNKKSEKYLIKDLSFKISPGSNNLILGKPGSGKTTLLALLSGMHKSYEGEIVISNSELKLMAPRVFRSHISNVPQSLIFMQGSIKNNLSGGLSVSSDKISKLLKDFFLDEFMEKLPMGLGTVVSPMAASLPIQIKKKLFLLKATIKSPKYIFVDETFSELDKNEIKEILEFYKSKGSTVITTSSDKSLTKLFDQTIEI